MDETPPWICPNNWMDWMLIFKDQPKQIKDGSKTYGRVGHIEVNNSDINAMMGNMPDNMKQLKFH